MYKNTERNSSVELALKWTSPSTSNSGPIVMWELEHDDALMGSSSAVSVKSCTVVGKFACLCGAGHPYNIRSFLCDQRPRPWAILSCPGSGPWCLFTEQYASQLSLSARLHHAGGMVRYWDLRDGKTS